MSSQAPENERHAELKNLAAQLTVAVLLRTAINTARRFPYTYASVLSRGMGVPLAAITSLIALSQATSLLAPLFGPMGDRRGYRVMMVSGLALLAPMALVGLFPSYGFVLLAVIASSLGKNIYDPALLAYVGQRVPYKKRGLAVGAMELAWAGATLAGIPLIGVLIERYDWRAPFVALGLLGLVGAFIIGRAIPHTKPPGATNAATKGDSSARILKQLIKTPTVKWVLGVGFLISIANDAIFVIYALWLEDIFSLGVTALGAATIAIGVAEVGGEGLTATLSDRLGLRRALALGVGSTSLAYLTLPLAGDSLTFALAGLFFSFLSFEFTMVTAFSLCTEVVPTARATMLSSYYTSSGLGRVIGALMGGALWTAFGLGPTAFICAGINIAALACIARFSTQGR